MYQYLLQIHCLVNLFSVRTCQKVMNGS